MNAIRMFISAVAFVLMAASVLGLVFSSRENVPVHNGSNWSLPSPEARETHEPTPLRATQADHDLMSARAPRLERSAQEPVSPYEIRRYILELHKEQQFKISLSDYWLRLGIPVEEWRQYSNCLME